MADPTNLNRARKAKARAEQTTQAAANRAAFGRTGAEKKAAMAEAERERLKLDGARLPATSSPRT